MLKEIKSNNTSMEILKNIIKKRALISKHHNQIQLTLQDKDSLNFRTIYQNLNNFTYSIQKNFFKFF